MLQIVKALPLLRAWSANLKDRPTVRRTAKDGLSGGAWRFVSFAFHDERSILYGSPIWPVFVPCADKRSVRNFDAANDPTGCTRRLGLRLLDKGVDVDSAVFQGAKLLQDLPIHLSYLRLVEFPYKQ